MVLSLLSTDGCAPASKPQRVIPGGLGESALIGTLHARTLHVILRPRRRRTRTHKWSTAKCTKCPPYLYPAVCISAPARSCHDAACGCARRGEGRLAGVNRQWPVSFSIPRVSCVEPCGHVSRHVHHLFLYGKLTLGAYDRSTRQIIAHGDGLSARALEASDAAARCDGRIAPGPSPPPRSPGWLPLRRRSCSRRRTVSAVPFAAARGAL